MKTKAVRGGVALGAAGSRPNLRSIGQRGVMSAGALGRGDADRSRVEEADSVKTRMHLKRSFREVLDWAVDSGGWLLIVVGLFILLPVGVMYLATWSAKEEAPAVETRVEADILAPVNILAD